MRLLPSCFRPKAQAPVGQHLDEGLRMCMQIVKGPALQPRHHVRRWTIKGLRKRSTWRSSANGALIAWACTFVYSRS